MRRRASNAAGFTLIELIVVLAIVGLALAVLMPNLEAGGETVALRAASSEVSAALRAARSRAIAANRDVLLAIEPDGHGYRVDGELHTLRSRGFVERALRIEPATRVVFFATGGSSGGRLAIRGRRGEQVIEIDGVSGQVAFGR
jgi:general secretion pathway protein H